MDLNDDCWLYIFKFLPLSEELKMLHVCKRFKILMETKLQRNHRKLNLNLISCPISGAQLNMLLSNICNTVTKINIKFLSKDHIRALQSHVYPSVTDLRFSQMDKSIMCDDDIAKLAKSFPNLRHFSPHGKFKGNHFIEFPHLEHITLSYCSKLCPLQLKNIMKRLPLRSIELNIDINIIEIDFEMNSLQRISLRTDEWSDLMAIVKVDNFPNLKAIEINGGGDYDKFLRSLPECMRNAAISLTIHQRSVDTISLNTISFINLQKLVINERDFNLICTWHKNMPALRELTIIHSRIYLQLIAPLVKRFTELKILNIIYCTLLENSTNVVDLSAILNSRAECLCINWYPIQPNTEFKVQNKDRFEFRSIAPRDTMNYEPIFIEFM